MKASDLFAAAQLAAEVLPDGASILLSTVADESTVRELAALVIEATLSSHMVLWGDRSPSVIYSAEFRLNGVRVNIQGERAATADDAVKGASKYLRLDDAAPAEAIAALRGGA